ncbi:MAG: metallophosphoesterase [Clostridia bacterium]|nr:metallophosphoesterase [Clostridia bacterium]
MALYAIADLHLSLGADKPMDVFRGWENYVERLEKNWRNLVTDEDTVVIAGDVSWGMKLEETEKDFAFLHSLPGKKLLLKGNHDYWWSTRNKIDGYLKEKGFDSLEIVFNSAVRVGEITVCGTRGWLYNAETPEDRKIVARENGRLVTSIKAAQALGGTPVVFLHYPPVYDTAECTELLNTMLEYGIKDCYFGHIHGDHAAKKAPIGEYKGIRMHLVSCDYIRFMPKLVRLSGEYE